MKKEELTKKLGALQFQKIVFKVEDFKYYLLNKFYILPKMYENNLRKRKNKLINNANSEEEIKTIEKNYQNDLILFHKELKYGKNRNYHFGIDNKTSFKNYLLWNKKVHEKGILTDTIVLLSTLIGTLIISPASLTIPIIISLCTSLGLIINFECVNLQNYHLERLKKVEKKLEEKNLNSMIQKDEKYHNAINAISDQMDKSSEFKIDEKSLKIEELKELKDMLLEVQNKDSKSEGKVRKLC